MKVFLDKISMEFVEISTNSLLTTGNVEQKMYLCDSGET